MLRSKVYEVTRLNYDYECKDQDKYEKAFLKQGVRVHYLPFTDGDIPSKAVVAEFLKQCKKALSKDATIALHCMGGMGRTGVMAGTHASAHHRVDGRAFHGWTRICRPGTVQTVKQEVL
ncbi:CDC14B [Symbiodinium pilosum]|uniref:CDC14B protein n=1 Tax=Symbiodinium pilosum TaxID=2952 RepID=A0A812R463_SYMPI|nr:CDC14B [Symbiodinium pilosum]